MLVVQKQRIINVCSLQIFKTPMIYIRSSDEMFFFLKPVMVYLLGKHRKRFLHCFPTVSKVFTRISKSLNLLYITLPEFTTVYGSHVYFEKNFKLHLYQFTCQPFKTGEKSKKQKKKFDEKHLPTKDFFGLQKYPLNISKLKFIIHSVKS